MVRSRKAAATACIIEISVVLRKEGMDFLFATLCVPYSSSKNTYPAI